MRGWTASVMLLRSAHLSVFTQSFSESFVGNPLSTEIFYLQLSTSRSSFITFDEVLDTAMRSPAGLPSTQALWLDIRIDVRTGAKLVSSVCAEQRRER